MTMGWLKSLFVLSLCNVVGDSKMPLVAIPSRPKGPFLESTPRAQGMRMSASPAQATKMSALQVMKISPVCGFVRWLFWIAGPLACMVGRYESRIG